MKIAAVTTSRADYSHLYWPLRTLHGHPGVDLHILAMAAHLSPEFGLTVCEIERDGLPVAARIECLLSSDTDIGMAKSIGVGLLSLADALGALRPDLLLLIADRYEMLAPAAAGLALRIPMAHIEGGERSEGAIDDAVRNALTKMCHIHFTSTPAARERVIAMGEEPWRVHRAGAPSLDYLRKSRLPPRPELEASLGLDLSRPTLVVAYHPVTLLRETTAEVEALFTALAGIKEQIVFCCPNADAGSRALLARIRLFLADRPDGKLYVNLPATQYWALLREASAMAGNSSSGIMETASFALPTVNVGLRQKSRERPVNVLDVAPEAGAILAALRQALSPAFRASLTGMVNPYGEGRAAERITEVLTTLPDRDTLLRKQG